MHRLAHLAFALAAALTFVLLPQSAEARSKTAIYGSSGDATGSAECPAGQQLVGFSGRIGLWVDRIQIVCASPLAGNHFSQPVAQGPEFGGTGGGRKDGFCPLDTMMTRASLALTRDDRQVASIDMDCVSRASGEPNYASFGNLDYKASCASVGIASGVDCPSHAPQSLACPSDEVPTGINVRYGQHVNALGLICARVAFAAPVVTPSAPPPPPKVVHHSGKAKVPAPGLAPVAMFGGKWETVTSQNAHFELILGTIGDGTAGSVGGTIVSIPMNVSGIFTNTDGAHDYDGTIGGVVQPNTRQLIYTFTQKNGGGGNGVFTLSTDGNSLTGEGVAGETHFTWNGHRAP